MSYYQPAIRLLPTDSQFVQKLNSASYDRGKTAVRTTGDFFMSYQGNRNSNNIYIYQEIANCQIQPEPAMCPGQLCF